MFKPDDIVVILGNGIFPQSNRWKVKEIIIGSNYLMLQNISNDTSLGGCYITVNYKAIAAARDEE